VKKEKNSVEVAFSPTSYEGAKLNSSEKLGFCKSKKTSRITLGQTTS
jgi:hypothetical protein